MVDIREQQALLQRLHYSVSVDGIASSQLVRSIKAFQRDYRREVTGYLSDDDMILMRACVRSRSTEVNAHA